MTCAWFHSLRRLARHAALAVAGFAAVLAGAAEPAAPLPVPPLQHEDWSVPADSGIPTNLVSATEALFAAGMADPRGGEYRTVVVRVGSLFSGDASKTETHGWLLPGSPRPTHAVCWNGLVYPVIDVGPVADLKKDVAALLTGRFDDRGWIPRETESVSHRTIEPIKGCLLLRLGETELARDFWLSLQTRSKPVDTRVGLFDQRRTFGDKKPTNNVPAKLDPKTPSPLPAWSTVWLGVALDRTLAAHVRGDFAEALTTARWLAGVRAKLPADSVPAATLASLDLLPGLIADLERRLAQTAPAVPDLESIAALPDAERAKAALAFFDTIAVRPRIQSGGVLWSDSEVFALVMDSGQAAVEPLLAALESDSARLLTRSIALQKDYQPERRVMPVADALIEALRGLLRIHSLDDVFQRAELDRAETGAHKVAAARFRDYIRRANAMTLQESWYATLLNDGARASWDQAMREIVAPGRFRSSFRRPSGPGPQLAGEILRTKTAPTVTELMLRRIGRWTPVPGDRTFGLAPFRSKIAVLAKWDAQAALDLTEETLLDVFKVWEAEAAKTDRDADLSSSAARSFGALVVEMAAQGRTNHLDLYASWVLRLGDQDYLGWIPGRDSGNNPLEPLWLYPDHPSIRDATATLLDPDTSRLRAWLTLGVGLRSFYVLEADSGLVGLPVFQPRLLEALADTTPVGTIERPGGGRYEVLENTGQRHGKRLFSDKYLDDKLPSMTLRLRDATAMRLTTWADLPRFELYWNEDERDARIDEFIRLLRAEGPDFAKRAKKGRR